MQQDPLLAWNRASANRDLLRRPTGLAVGLALKELAPPPGGGLAPKTWFPRSRCQMACRTRRFGRVDRRHSSASVRPLLTKRKYLVLIRTCGGGSCGANEDCCASWA